MSQFLKDLEAFVKTLPFTIIRATEICRGQSETLEYSPGNPCQNTYSVAKLFTATAIGILWDRKELRLDEKICDIFAQELPAEGMDERWYETTVEMVLTHSAGLPGGFLDIDCNRSADFTQDFLRHLFTCPLVYDPGTQSRYSDGAFYLLSRVVSKKTGKKLDDFLWEECLWEMGFQEMAWSHCPKGYPMGATGLYIHSEDMAKLGEVYLHGGLYGTQRVLSEQWVNAAVEKGYAIEWDDTHTIYYKGGMCGQKLIVAPQQDRVLALQAYGANSDTIAKWVREYKD